MTHASLILDTETTTIGGQVLSFYASEMVGLSGGGIGFSESGLEPPLPLYIIPDADRPISPAAFLVHHLTSERILNEPNAYTSFEAAVLLHDWLNALHRKAPISFTAWNARFDYGVLNDLFDRALLPSFFVSWGEKPPLQSDLMQMFSVMQLRYPNDFPIITKASLKTGQTYASRTLGDATRSAGMSLDGIKQHDVVDDVERLASGMFQHMWAKDYRLMRHMWGMSDRSVTQALLRQTPDAPLYHIDTSGQVAVGRFVLSIPLPEEGRKKDAPWQIKRNAAVICIDAANIEYLRDISVSELADMLSPPLDAHGKRQITRAYLPEDVAAIRQQPIAVLNIRDHLMIFDKGAQELLNVKADKHHAKTALALATDKLFQQKVYAAWQEVISRDTQRKKDKDIVATTFPTSDERKAMEALRFDFHSARSWENRAQVMRRMSGKDRVNALRILNQHAPHTLSAVDVREWQTHLQETLLTEEDVPWVTLPSIERFIGEALASKTTPQADKRLLRHFKATELPRMKAHLAARSRINPRQAAEARAEL